MKSYTIVSDLNAGGVFADRASSRRIVMSNITAGSHSESIKTHLVAESYDRVAASRSAGLQAIRNIAAHDQARRAG